MNNFYLRSEKLRDFITRKPDLLTRIGIPASFLLLLLFTIGTIFVSYPDTITAKARVVAVNPPVQIFNNKGGRLIKLLKPDNSVVTEEETIGYVESTGNHTQVLKLDSLLAKLQNLAASGRFEEIPAEWETQSLAFNHLGELQSSHQVFIQGYVKFKDFLASGYSAAKMKALQHDLNIVLSLQSVLRRQKKLHEQDLSLAVQNFSAHDTLHREAVLSDLDYRNQQSLLLSKKMTIPQIDAALLSNQAQQNEIRKQIMEIENQPVKEMNIFIQALQSYRSIISEWIRNYVIKAPVSGTFRYAGFLQEQQKLSGGETIGFLTRPNSEYFLEMYLPQIGLGKVRKGQVVWLSFQAYPFQEYGKIKGYIDHIKQVSSDSGYLAKVVLPGGLITEYNKEIFLTDGLSAEASIITDKRRLSSRLFGRLFQ